MATEVKTNGTNLSSPERPKTDAAYTAKEVWTLTHKGGTNWVLNGKAITPAEALQVMRAKKVDVPVWLEREVRTGKTLEQRRAAKIESAARRAAEKSGNWTL